MQSRPAWIWSGWLCNLLPGRGMTSITSLRNTFSGLAVYAFKVFLSYLKRKYKIIRQKPVICATISPLLFKRCISISSFHTMSPPHCSGFLAPAPLFLFCLISCWYHPLLSQVAHCFAQRSFTDHKTVRIWYIAPTCSVTAHKFMFSTFASVPREQSRAPTVFSSIN